MYTIEKNVPFPSKTGRPAIFPYANMEVGDSFVIAGRYDSGKVQSAYIAAKKYFGATGHISTKRIDENHTRVWRIK
jgi:hypothetical protein